MSWKTFVSFLFIATTLCACENCNLATFGKKYIDPASHKLISRGFLAVLAFAWWIIFRKPFLWPHFVGIVVLIIGAVLSAINVKSEESKNQMFVTINGLLLLFAEYSLKACGNLGLEKTFKEHTNVSIITQSFVLSICSTTIAFLAWLSIDFSNFNFGQFQGQSIYFWLAMTFKVINVLAVSALTKSMSSIARFFCGSLSLVALNIVTWKWLKKEGNAWSFSGMALIIIGSMVYQYGYFLQNEDQNENEHEEKADSQKLDVKSQSF